MDKKLNLLIQSSDFYAPFAGVMLTSLFENNLNLDEINVYLLTADMSEENRKCFENLAKKYHHRIHFLDSNEIDTFLYEHEVPEWRGSYATYYKIFALSIIKEDIDRLIYLDSDMLVNGSILDLINYDLKDNILGMCVDVVSQTHKKLIKHYSEFYYNAGMVVFNVKSWITENCREKVIKHIKNVHSAYPVVDQDLLNLVFSGKIQKIPLIYNFNTDILIYKNSELIKKIYGINKWYSHEECLEAQKKAVIFHCFGTITMRPWILNNDHPLKKMWRDYLNRSPWSNFTFIDEKMKFPFRCQRYFFRILPPKAYAFVHRNVTGFLQYMRARKLKVK